MNSKMITATGLTIVVKIASEIFSFFSSIIVHCVLHGSIHAFQELCACFHALSQVSSRVFHRGSYGKNNMGLIDTTSENRGNNDVISEEDIMTVMKSLGLPYDDARPHSIQDVVDIFYDQGPTFDEVREAFYVFDGNNDGFIDAEELKKVFDSIGLAGFCEEDCRRMMVDFDENCDGKIDLGEFAKVVEECFYSCTD